MIEPKLVRNRIPELIIKSGKVCVIKKELDPYELNESLKRKLYEEVNEFCYAENAEERIEELADILQVIHEIMTVNGISRDQLKQAIVEKTTEKGDFSDHIILLGVRDEK